MHTEDFGLKVNFFKDFFKILSLEQSKTGGSM